MRIPAYCPMCREFFPSLMSVIGGGTHEMHGVGTKCPKGHSAIFIDGTYKIGNGLLRIYESNPADIRDIEDVATRVATGKITAVKALAEISRISPELSALISAAVGKNSSLKDMILYILVLISLILGATDQSAKFVRNIRTLYHEFSSVPEIVVNDDKPAVNKRATRKKDSGSVSKSLTTEQIRKQKQLAKKKQIRKQKERKKLQRQQSLGK